MYLLASGVPFTTLLGFLDLLVLVYFFVTKTQIPIRAKNEEEAEDKLAMALEPYMFHIINEEPD